MSGVLAPTLIPLVISFLIHDLRHGRSFSSCKRAWLVPHPLPYQHFHAESCPGRAIHVRIALHPNRNAVRFGTRSGRLPIPLPSAPALISSSFDIQLQGSPGFSSVHPPVPQVHHVSPYCFGEVPVVLPGVADRIAPQAPVPSRRPSVAGFFTAVPPCLCNLEVPYHLSYLF